MQALQRSGIQVNRNIIYGLIDPRTKLVRYIGKCTRGLKRAKAHSTKWCLAQPTYSAAWIKTLIAVGLIYEVTILEVTTIDLLSQAERWWISYGRASRWPLTNLTDGGEGAPGMYTSRKLRQARSARAKQMWNDDEYRNAHSGEFSHTKRTEVRDNISKGLKQALSTPEAKKMMTAAANKRWGSKDYRDKHSGNNHPSAQPGFKDKMSKVQAIAQSKSETRERHRVATAAVWAQPGYRERVSKKQRELAVGRRLALWLSGVSS